MSKQVLGSNAGRNMGRAPQIQFTTRVAVVATPRGFEARTVRVGEVPAKGSPVIEAGEGASRIAAAAAAVASAFARARGISAEQVVI